METKKSLKKSPIFSCKLCDYTTSKKCNFDKHVSTRKHELMVSLETTETKKKQKVAQHNMCEKCKKIYNTRSGLWKHVKICDYIPEPHDLSSEDCEEMELSINSNSISVRYLKQSSRCAQSRFFHWLDVLTLLPQQLLPK